MPRPVGPTRPWGPAAAVGVGGRASPSAPGRRSSRAAAVRRAAASSVASGGITCRSQRPSPGRAGRPGPERAERRGLVQADDLVGDEHAPRCRRPGRGVHGDAGDVAPRSRQRGEHLRELCQKIAGVRPPHPVDPARQRAVWRETQADEGQGGGGGGVDGAVGTVVITWVLSDEVVVGRFGRARRPTVRGLSGSAGRGRWIRVLEVVPGRSCRKKRRRPPRVRGKGVGGRMRGEGETLPRDERRWIPGWSRSATGVPDALGLLRLLLGA